MDGYCQSQRCPERVHCTSKTGCVCVCVFLNFLCLVSAVRSLGTAMGLSLYSTTSLEDVALEAPNTIKFFQMQLYTDRQLMATITRRAEKAGYKAILLTVDCPLYGRHQGRRRFELPGHLKHANFSSVQQRKRFKSNAELGAHIIALLDCSVDWKILDWLRSITSLPVVVKGILTPEDARLAVQHGAKGILVSNHGGRQLDGVSAAVCMTLVQCRMIFE